MTPPPPARPGDAGLRAIVAYKSIKGAAEFAAALALAALVVTGRADALERLAGLLREHVARGWASRGAGALAALATPPHVALAALALALDGALTSVEGRALRRGRPWGEWLVVVATGGLLPYEALELVERVRLGRAAVFAINVAVVAYLARRVMRRRASGGPPAAGALAQPGRGGGDSTDGPALRSR